MDFLSANSLPWLREAQQRLQAAQQSGHLPHSLLVLSAPGLGAEPLARWITALALCESQDARPCDACASCRLLRSDSHPDVHIVRLEEDAQQIKIDQIRELIDALATKSYRGGYKVGVIEGAEALNANGANAFLKTLEEPAANTVLIMIARPIIACRSPLPAAACASSSNRRRRRMPLHGSKRTRRPPSRGTQLLPSPAVHRCWRCTWMPTGWPRSMPTCANASLSWPKAPWMSRCWRSAGTVPIRTYVSPGLRTGSHSEYVHHWERQLRIKVRNRSACLLLYLSPR